MYDYSQMDRAQFLLVRAMKRLEGEGLFKARTGFTKDEWIASKVARGMPAGEAKQQARHLCERFGFAEG